jgi:hypothetical protein
MGSLIVLRSKFTGRWLFTAYIHTESPNNLGKVVGKCAGQLPTTQGVPTARMQALKPLVVGPRV